MEQNELSADAYFQKSISGGLMNDLDRQPRFAEFFE